MVIRALLFSAAAASALFAAACDDCGPPPECPDGTVAAKYYSMPGRNGHGGDGSGTCHWDCDPVDPAPSAAPAAMARR